MTIFNETSKERISQAYDLFKKEDFLERLFKFMEDSEKLIREQEQRNAQGAALLNRIIEGAKTKKGVLRGGER